mmetsp:Transcript_32334/g.39356  ORF Transcript_32334/g.39356 Transcript_32334/m.39356 type:complete len:191 (+) Transcript_32334:105-677(+)
MPKESQIKQSKVNRISMSMVSSRRSSRLRCSIALLFITFTSILAQEIVNDVPVQGELLFHPETPPKSDIDVSKFAEFYRADFAIVKKLHEIDRNASNNLRGRSLKSDDVGGPPQSKEKNAPKKPLNKNPRPENGNYGGPPDSKEKTTLTYPVITKKEFKKKRLTDPFLLPEEQVHDPGVTTQGKKGFFSP